MHIKNAASARNIYLQISKKITKEYLINSKSFFCQSPITKLLRIKSLEVNNFLVGDQPVGRPLKPDSYNFV